MDPASYVLICGIFMPGEQTFVQYAVVSCSGHVILDIIEHFIMLLFQYQIFNLGVADFY